MPIQLKFDSQGNEKQKLAYTYWADNVTDELLYGGGKFGGKSFLGCCFICGDALMYAETSYFIARKSLNDLRKETRKSIDEVMKMWNIPKSYYKYNTKDDFYTLGNGSTIFFLECKYLPGDPDFARFGSRQYTRGWIEEAGEVHEKAKQNLSASVGRWKNAEHKIPGKLLITCNPTKNWIYRDFYRPARDGVTDPTRALPPNRKFVKALAQDNKAGDGVTYAARLERTLTGGDRQRLLYGNWEYDEDPTILMEYEAILDMFQNNHVPPSGTKCITSDIARLGGDRIVKISWRGYVGTVTAWQWAKLPVTLSKLEAERVKLGVEKKMVLIDADGMGVGIEDFSYGFIGFKNGSSALPNPLNKYDGNGRIVRESFDNVKSQCGFGMAELINERKVKLICEDKSLERIIISELEQVRQGEETFGTDKKKSLEKKEVVSKRVGHSLDFWSAILMRKWFDLKPRTRRITTITGNESRMPIGDRRRWKDIEIS